jgi:hypothetical protein
MPVDMTRTFSPFERTEPRRVFAILADEARLVEELRDFRDAAGIARQDGVFRVVRIVELNVIQLIHACAS